MDAYFFMLLLVVNAANACELPEMGVASTIILTDYVRGYMPEQRFRENFHRWDSDLLAYTDCVVAHVNATQSNRR